MGHSEAVKINTRAHTPSEFMAESKMKWIFFIAIIWKNEREMKRQVKVEPSSPTPHVKNFISAGVGDERPRENFIGFKRNLI